MLPASAPLLRRPVRTDLDHRDRTSELLAYGVVGKYRSVFCC